MKKSVNSNGFTLIELMVATTVFSIVMLMCATAILQIGKIYYKGLNQAKAQETARSITEEIVRAIQFSNSSVMTATDTYCIGKDRYSYVINTKINLSAPVQKHVLWADGRTNLNACVQLSSASSRLRLQDNPSTASPIDPNYELSYPTRELLAENMRLLDFSVLPVGPAPVKSYVVTVNIGIGDNDQFDPATKTCKSGAGGQFCATSHLTTVVTRRLQ